MCVCLTASSLRAEEEIEEEFRCPAVPAKEEVATKKAGRYFNEGAKLAEQEKYLQSLARYLCSLRMKPHPNTMFNIAQLAKLIVVRGPAIQQLIKFRNRNEGHPSLPEITDLIARMESGDIDAIGANTPPEEPAPPEPSPPSEPQPADEEIANSAPEPAATDKGDRRLKIAGITLLAGSGAFLAMGVGMNAAAAGAKKDAEGATSYDGFTYSEERMSNFTAGSVIGYLLTAGLATAGIVCLYRFRHPAEQPDPRTEMSVRLRPGFLSVSGTF
jgi:hypothetical protein